MSVIYCVEDDTSIRELIIYAVQSIDVDISGFANASEFEKQMSINLPDMILLDIMLPDKDGIQLLNELKANSSTNKIPIIIITAKTLKSDKIKSFELGADDYVTKPFSVLELISRIKAVLRRSGLYNENVFNHCGIKLDNAARTVFIDKRPISLTYKEFELLLLLLKSQGHAVKREELLNTIWGYDYEGETRTLDVHIRSLRHKMGEKGSLIETVRNVGYKLK